MADQPGPAQGGKGLPLWVIIGGVVAVAGFLYFRHRSAASQAAIGTGTPGVATDPNTGLPIDPLTGLPYITNPTTPQTNDTWATAAEQWAVTHGIGAALANQAIYDYLNGNSLSTQESDILNKILSGFGFPPDILPFFGHPSQPKPTPAPPVIQPGNGPSPTPKPVGNVLQHVNASSFPQFISAILTAPANRPIPIPHGGDVVQGAPVYALVNTGYGPVYEQGAPVNAALASGKQVFTLPQFSKYVQIPKQAA